MRASWWLARARRVPARELPGRAIEALWRRWVGGGPDLAGPDDPRAAWEAGRLLELGPDDLDRALAFCRDHPPGRGLHWACAAEVAHRLVSLERIDARSLSRPLLDHARFVAAHPTPPSSAYNHRVAELGGLAVAQTTFPDERGWDRQLATFPQVLARQLRPDGLGVEQAPAYLAQVLEWGLLARSRGVAGLDDSLRRGADALASLLDEGGHLPDVGDDDGGCVLPGPRDRYACSVVGAVLASLGEPVPTTWSPDERSAALGVPTAVARRTERSRTFADAGLTVLRHQGLTLVVDHGPLGGPPLSAHGHADALAIWLSVDGRPVLGGRGTGRYVGDPVARRFHRGTSAHATVVVDGADQSVQHDHPFLWRTSARAKLEDLDLARRTLTASHDGYRERRGVEHRRTVRLADRRVELWDTIEGRGRHHVAVVLPLRPGADLRVEVDPRCVLRERTDPHAPRYGQPTVEARTLVAEAVLDAPFTIRTVLSPASG
ncbi:MAG: heparinase II/III family protein [Alphaproteobacteria bacterium]|nr:heparinase II/III family protein [Alphaproteobacteria bacterium]MCB9697352.1 heparinase II/III family protein [Alphaproteobacteria bacterium]